ncbi:endothelin-converting metalloprotease family [Plasmopara halstedii]|uniref:Endothelin-converting metalloprotease family n=1 Tax=Plasmopara halstedii TaxID=4781 RepID=A0A0P1A4V6_PLAHL|nr:endothelin-converting metalloprotease family [Plasmopara halstedii]CEG35337.1 endothelin-converting metalloprotease family [Plasmopara halstedii]|eukprot:XP_024571706.1 endothelin-converting metalloprotease family [Plasmopara halstedii]
MERSTGSKWIKVDNHDRSLSPVNGDESSKTQQDDEQLLGNNEEDSLGQATPTPLLLRSPVAAWAVTGLGLLFLLVVILVVRGGIMQNHQRIQVATLNKTEWFEMLPEDIVVHMNLDVDPCVDFYEFSCGSWLNQMKIPEDKSSYSLAFTTVHDENQEILKQLMSHGWPLVGELYDSCMNYSNISTAAADETSFQILMPNLQLIAATKTKKQLFQLAGNLSITGPSFLTGLSVSADAKEATVYALYASQMGLTLPDPEYYLDTKKFATVEDAFHGYITKLFRLVGVEADAAAAQAIAVITFQQQLAPLYVPKEKLQDPVATYNRMSIAKAADMYPFLFADFLNGTGLLTNFLANHMDVIVETPAFFERAETLVTNETVTLETLKALLQYQYISSHAMALSASYVSTNFDFFSKTLRGQTKLPDRWKLCLQFVTSSFPELVGKYYTLLRFDNTSEDLAKDLVTQVQTTLHETFGQLDWLDEHTRQAAMFKLTKMTNLIGHSTHKKHFPFELHANASLLTNLQILSKYQFDEAVAKLGTKVDRTKWSITSATANAFYQPTSNQIVFPAGILQIPFFSQHYHLARNYGAIGSIIGHELTHGFDAQGRYFDGDGNLYDWWSNATAREFQTRTDCLVAQYTNYTVYSEFEKEKFLDHVNGKYTLSENIADNGGVKLAFAAYHRLNESEKKLKTNDEMSRIVADRLFFLSFAQTFCDKSRDASMMQRLTSDPHPPGRYRVNGVVSNSYDFAQVYSCSKDSPMNPTTKCQLW